MFVDYWQLPLSTIAPCTTPLTEETFVPNAPVQLTETLRWPRHKAVLLQESTLLLTL